MTVLARSTPAPAAKEGQRCSRQTSLTKILLPHPLDVCPSPRTRRFLERLELAMREHLGALYPAVVLAQTGVLLAAGARLAVRRIGRWRRWQGRPSKHV